MPLIFCGFSCVKQHSKNVVLKLKVQLASHNLFCPIPLLAPFFPFRASHVSVNQVCSHAVIVFVITGIPSSCYSSSNVSLHFNFSKPQIFHLKKTKLYQNIKFNWVDKNEKAALVEDKDINSLKTQAFLVWSFPINLVRWRQRMIKWRMDKWWTGPALQVKHVAVNPTLPIFKTSLEAAKGTNRDQMECLSRSPSSSSHLSPHFSSSSHVRKLSAVNK